MRSESLSAIRLIGEHHTSHSDRTMLTVADEATARTDPNTVTLEHARNLVASGEAEWVGETPGEGDGEPPVITLADEAQIDHPDGQ
jgi:hypothetical protein